eukprot:CAMPEP_0119314770 /NCGR_PEP_ID=MMETSP1333-20130426/34001_1 /TAXON_ID=418940 /ORGANISM="Scyphosphaera apsteinii, Strain RCC1455" /LENGTH=256 /DNA_ID=CAMNT_0007319967 /DNA_START=79 /DNA_END=849 /DNA_ORIENTATION=+
MATYAKSDDVDGRAPSWALQRARQIVSQSEIIKAVYVVSDKNCKNILNVHFLGPMFVPCCLPFSILTSPCGYMAYKSSEAHLKSTVYIVTDKRFYISIDDGLGKITCNNCTCSGQFFYLKGGNVALSDIYGMSPERLMTTEVECSCAKGLFPIEQVILALPQGHPLAAYGASRYSGANKAIIYVDNPQAVIQLLQSSKDGTASPLAILTAAAVPEAMEIDREAPAEKIKKLKDLLDIGAVTQAEFDEKKKVLLNKM